MKSLGTHESELPNFRSTPTSGTREPPTTSRHRSSMFHSGNVSRTPPLLLAPIPTVSDRDPHLERAHPFPSRTISHSRSPGILRRCRGDIFSLGGEGAGNSTKNDECGDPNRMGGHFEELGLAETTHAPLSIGTPTWDPARGTLPQRENLPRELVSQNKFNNFLLFLFEPFTFTFFSVFPFFGM